MKYLAVLIVTLLSLQAFSQESPYARAVLDTNSIVIGRQVNMHLEVTTANNEKVLWADIPTQIAEGVEVVQRSPIDSMLENNRTTLKQTLSITSFDTGFYALPPLRFPYYNEGDTTTHFTQTPSVWLEVTTVAVDTTQAFYDIKPVMKAPVTFREVLPYILIFLGAGILIAFLTWFIARRKKKEPIFRITPPKPKIPAHITALKALEELRHEKLWQAGRVKDYYSKLTDILRVYIEDRFNVQAVEMTTDEILYGLKKDRINELATGKLADVLQTADLVKFAKASPLPLENDTVLNYGIDFVQETKLQPVEPEKQEQPPQNNQGGAIADSFSEPKKPNESEPQNVTP